MDCMIRFFSGRLAGRRLVGLFAATVVLLLSVSSARAAEEPPRLPSRLETIRVGDWFTFRGNGVLVRETCFHIEGEGADRVVHYAVEFMNEKWTVLKKARLHVDAKTTMIRLPELQAALAAGAVAVEKEMPTIGDKKVDVYAVKFRNHPVWLEVWLTDRLSIHGVAMTRGTKGKGGLPIEPVDFGYFFEDTDPRPPLRWDKLNVGDWITLRYHSGRTVRKTVVSLEKQGLDTRIFYKEETLDEKGAVVESWNFDMSLLDAREKNLWTGIVMSKAGTSRKDTMTVGGKKINVVVYTEDVGNEVWYSDQASIDGVVKVVQYMMDGSLAQRSFEMVDFGSAL